MERHHALGFLLDLHEAELAVVEYDDLDRQLFLDQREQIAHQHRETAIAAQRNDLTARVARLQADR